MKKLFYFQLFIPLLFFLSCATTGITQKSAPAAQEGGVWHRVLEGQTLWRIAKTYRVSLEDIKEANDIEDVVHIAKGTWIKIPNVSKALLVQGNAPHTQEDNSDMGFIWPLQGEVVTSFGKVKNDFSYGIDIKAGGNENIVASLEGMVVVAGTIRGYGNTIIIEHENNFCSLYSKNFKSLVKEGQVVKKNSVIAKTESFREPAAEIIHYELFYRGKPVNPLYYLP